MRALALVLVGLVVSACVTIGVRTTPPPSTPAPTPGLTAQPPTAQPPSAEPPSISPATNEPVTPDPATPDPNITPDPNATPEPTTLDLLPYLTSELLLVNLAAQPVSLNVSVVDADSGESFDLGMFDAQPEQVTAQAVVPARYRLVFNIGGSEVGTCVIDVADAEQLQFAVIEQGIVLTSNGSEPTDAAEMVVATSSRCAAGAAP